MFARDHFGHSHAFVFGFVGQHRAFDHVTDGIDARHVCAPLPICRDLSAFGQLDASGVQTQTLVIGATTCCHQDHVCIQSFLCVGRFLEGVFNLGFGFAGVHAGHRSAHDKVQVLLFKDTFECPLHVGIHAGAHGVHVFHDSDFRPEASIDRPQFQTNHACANHDHFLRHFGQLKRTGGIHHDAFVVVDLNTGQGRGNRTGRDHDILGLIRGVTDLDLACGLNGAIALDPVDLVLFEQEFDAASVLTHNVGFIGLHLLPIDRRRFALEAHIGKIVLGFVQHMRGVQQRLGRDTPHVQAGTAKGLATFDHCGFQAKLGTANGRHIAAGACADDDDVILGHGSFSF